MVPAVSTYKHLELTRPAPLPASSEVPYPSLLLSASPDEPLTYQSRLAPLPFELGQPRLDQRPNGGLPPGQTVRTIGQLSHRATTHFLPNSRTLACGRSCVRGVS